jgi:acyl carrier protein
VDSIAAVELIMTLQSAVGLSLDVSEVTAQNQQL